MAVHGGRSMAVSIGVCIYLLDHPGFLWVSSPAFRPVECRLKESPVIEETPRSARKLTILHTQRNSLPLSGAAGPQQAKNPQIID
jgi:hypothetical protein